MMTIKSSTSFKKAGFLILLFSGMGLLLSCSTANKVTDKSEALSNKNSPETFYAAMYSTRKTKLAGKNPEVGVFITSDNGKTWHHTGWTVEHTFSVMAAPGGTGDTIFTACGNGVLRTTDGGHFWKITTDWDVDEVQAVTINPSRRNQVFAGTPYGMYRSEDLGNHWEKCNDGLTSNFIASVRVDRKKPDRVWAGTQKGLFVSDDAGDHWISTTITEPVRSVRQSMSDPDHWVVGLTIRGIAVSSDGGKTWKYSPAMTDTTTIYECEFDPHNADVLYAGGWKTGVMRSDDFGKTWKQETSGMGYETIHALAVSKNQPGLVFAGSMGDGLFRSTDGGKSWEAISKQIFDQGQIWDLYVEGEQ